MNLFDSEVFESNELFIEGNTFKHNCTKIFSDFECLFDDIFEPIEKEKDIVNTNLNITNLPLKDSLMELQKETSKDKLDLKSEPSELLLSCVNQNIKKIIKNLDVSDIYICSLEEEVDKIITENKEKIIGKKKIFNLDKDLKDKSKLGDVKSSTKETENISFSTNKDSFAAVNINI